MAGSAGMRNGSNIELMHMRRNMNREFPLEDTDQWGRGVQVSANYFMLI